VSKPRQGRIAPLPGRWGKKFQAVSKIGHKARIVPRKKQKCGHPHVFGGGEKNKRKQKSATGDPRETQARSKSISSGEKMALYSGRKGETGGKKVKGGLWVCFWCFRGAHPLPKPSSTGSKNRRRGGNGKHCGEPRGREKQKKIKKD